MKKTKKLKLEFVKNVKPRFKYMTLKEKYQKQVIPEMKKEFNLSNIFQVPRIKKVTVNVGTGKIIKDANSIEEIKKALRSFCGQNPVATKAKISISGFKLRQGMEIGMKATLRGKRMWDFLDKLINVALPRVKDFQGIKKSSIDQGGNINIGIKEHLVFPEIVPEDVRNMFSLQVTVGTTAKDQEISRKFFKALGFPLKEDN